MRNTYHLQRGAALTAFILPQIGCFLIAFLVLGLGSAQTVSVPPPTFPTVTPSTGIVFQLEDVVAAENIDRDGCAIDITDTFSSDATFYIVLQDSGMAQGTTVFVRLYHEGEALEDSDEITAQQDYSNVCVNFAFENDTEWDSGEYEAQYFINGTAYQSVHFTVP